ncbi:MAG TPA: hypothetical protein VFW04_00815 [Gemmatimonadaceae bacterium]|nr:hypothetical protein [Gemmatimonadaceae bacterium]
MIQDVTTALAPDVVLAEAKRYFPSRNPLYAAFIEKEGAGYVTFRGQGGEELVIGVMPIEGGTRVRGSTYLFDAQISRFFASLDPHPMVEEITG